MKTFRILVVTGALLLLCSPAFASDVVNPSAFDGLLQKYVNSHGRVNYAAWHKDKADRARLKKYMYRVATAKTAGHSRHARLAFYIDAYNATVISSILHAWPTQSVMKVDGFFKKKPHRIAGKKMTLDHLETAIIRHKFKDARVHFVLVCGAISCPRLRRHALSEQNLDQTLTAAAKEFIPQRTKVAGKHIVTSKILKWFAADFKRDGGSVRKFMAKYLSGAKKKAVLSKKHSLHYRKYNWKLNKQ